MKFCIDAGHNYSGGDTGAVGFGEREEVFTFKIADKLRTLLESRGIEVIMTRTALTSNLGKTVTESINKRVEIANNSLCDLFISIHCNAHNSIKANGTETLVFGLGGEAEKLAAKVNKCVADKLGTSNRGVKVRTDLGVLKYTNAPAILVETAFITNEYDINLLRTHSDDFAYAIFEGTLKYLNIETEENRMDVQKAIEVLQTKAGLEEKTIEFLLCYKYGEALVAKLAEAME